MSKIEELIKKAVAEMSEGPSKDVLIVISELAQQDLEVVLPELFVEIEDAAEGVNLDNIAKTDLMPDPLFTKSVVNSVLNEDVKKINALLNNDPDMAIPTLLATIVALKKSL